MTLRVIEGFDYLPDSVADNILGALGWSGSGVDNLRFLSTTAFGYGKSMSWTGPSNTNFANKFLRGQWTTSYVFGVRMNVPLVGESASPEIGVYGLYGLDTTSSRNNQWQLAFDQFGTISFINYTNGNGAVYAKTLPWAFVPGTWFYLEVKITPGVSGGTLQIRINTVPVLSLTGLRISDGNPVLPSTNYGITHLSWGFVPIVAIAGFSNDWRSDDFYFLTTDGSENNDYLGNVRVKYMSVISNASPIQWSIGGTAPAPTNWQSVLNINTDDTKYVTTSGIGNQDLYNVDPNLDTPYVYGIEVAGAYRQDDATQRFVKNAIKSGSTTSLGTEYAINASYTYYYDIFELNPDTGIPFTGAQANAIDIGPKLTG
jgi:hypothetical protein